MTRLLHVLITVAHVSAATAGAAIDTAPELQRIDEDLIRMINDRVSADRLRDYHILLAKEPHVAGTPGDWRQIERLEVAFQEMGLTSVRHEIWPLLASPVSAELEITSPEKLTLSLLERPLRQDADSSHPDLNFGWNAFAGSGEVNAEVVYANYGTEADFKWLKENGISLQGKIVLARYGGNYRGYKVTFAQNAGAAGVIIFSDPADVGFVQGPVYPEGGYFNDCCIQRGSVLKLDYQGDPLTPGVEATENARRLTEQEADLPTIPSQPIGYGAAKEILSRMTGDEVPPHWKGGLPLTYRLTGGSELKVRMKVEQKRAITKTANVLASIKGSLFPDELVIIGAHHDAWGHGASDPTCGTITVLEAARQFARLAAEGQPPLRTVIFAAWGAEEFSIIGSSEWVEAHREELKRNGVAYLNLDMASMGPNFGASASPSLRRVIERCMQVVPQAGKDDGTMIADSLGVQLDAPVAEGEAPVSKVGQIGGGSDHVAFLCHTAVSCASFGSGGAKGSAYHSAYDTLPWYWKTVGDDYASAKMVTQMTCAFITAMAYNQVIPILPHVNFQVASGYALDKIQSDSEHEATWRHVFQTLQEAEVDTAAAHRSTLKFQYVVEETPQQARMINEYRLKLDRAWLSKDGLNGRPWFQNLLIAPDQVSGYDSWMLPGVVQALRSNSYRERRKALSDIEVVRDRAQELIEDFRKDLDRQQR